MPNIIKTIYQDGVFKPIKKVKLPENTKVEIATLIDYSHNFDLYATSKDLLDMFRYARETYKKSRVKLPSGLEFQRKIRKESDGKINLRLKELHV